MTIFNNKAKVVFLKIHQKSNFGTTEKKIISIDLYARWLLGVQVSKTITKIYGVQMHYRKNEILQSVILR